MAYGQNASSCDALTVSMTIAFLYLLLDVLSWLREQMEPISAHQFVLHLSTMAEQHMGGSSGAVSHQTGGIVIKYKCLKVLFWPILIH